MTNWVILLIKQFIDIIKYLLVADALFDLEYDKNKKLKEILALSIMIVLVYIVLFEHIVDIWIELNVVICFISLIILFRNNNIKTLKILIVSIIITTIIEQFIDLFIKYKWYEISSIEFLISNILRISIILGIYCFIRVIKSFYNNDSNLNDVSNFIYTNIILGFSGAMFPLYFVIVYQNLINSRIELMISLIAGLNLIISIVSVILFVKNKNEKDKYYLESLVKDETLKLQEDY